MFDLQTKYSSSKKLINISINNCDKDGTIVAKRLSSCINCVAPTRSLKIEVDRETDNTYLKDMGNKVVRYYDMAKGGQLLNFKTIVISSVHRAALYFAEVLHAPILPAQFISFASSWYSALRRGSFSIAGADYDSPFIWQWNKIDSVESFPSSYIELINDCDDLFIIRSKEDDSENKIIGKFKNLFINSSLTKLQIHDKYWQEIKYSLEKINTNSFIGDWEWSLPDATIQAIYKLWHSFGKNPRKIHIIEASVINLYKIIPIIWEKYLSNNSIPVNGFTLNSYWTAHPYYERYTGLLPFHFYNFSTIVDQIKFFFDKYMTNLKPSTKNIVVFANTIGSEREIENISSFLRKYELNDMAWFSNGIDSSDAVCKDIFGNVIPQPYIMVAKWIADSPYKGRDFNPLIINDFMKVYTNFIF